MKTIKAMKLALETLDRVMSHGKAVQEAKDILHAAIKQAQPYCDDCGGTDPECPLAEKPWVKTYAGGKPNYTTPKEQPEQEPVAWRTFDGEGGYDYRSYDDNENYAAEWAQRNPRHVDWVEPLYTAPQRREWVKMTDAEIFASLKATFGDDVKLTPGFRAFARAIEAKLKEKNT